MVKTDGSWRLALDKQRKLRKRGAEVLWERVKLMVQCYEDEEFRSWVFGQGTNPEKFMDEELKDTGWEFSTLSSVFRECPEKEDWLANDFRVLIAQAKAKQRKEREVETDKIKWKARALAAEKECERLRAELDSLKKSLEIVAGAKCA